MWHIINCMYMNHRRKKYLFIYFYLFFTKMCLVVKVNLLCKHKEGKIQDILFVAFNILLK